MTNKYNVTYKVASKGSGYVYQANKGRFNEGDYSVSAAGHMWYVLSDGITSSSYGFESREGEPIGAGVLSWRDDAAYRQTIYEVTLQLTAEQYRDLKAFSSEPSKFGFNDTVYNFLTNSCVDFAYASLKAIGYNDRGFEGAPLPSANVRHLDTLLLTHGANIVRNDLVLKKDYYDAKDARMCLWLGGAYPLLPSDQASGPPSAVMNIDISPSPQPQRGVPDEDKGRRDVRNGFVVNLPTHSISFGDGSLNKTDFTSTQIASMASGGVRPGEVQRDPNARPNTYLSQFYQDPNAGKRDYGLRNAVTLNGLSAMTTFNTFVDPLLLDLTGNGVRMTDLQDAVLFDSDNSATLKRTGWADRSTGMLVVDDGSGQITSVSQMFSEYYGGKTGVDRAAGEVRFKDGFQALASEDADHSGVIDHNDPIWRTLRVWIDASHDAKTGEGELKTPDELGISQIMVTNVASSDEVRNGSRVLSKGSFVINGESREMLSVDFLGDPVSNTVEAQNHGARVTSTLDGITTTAFASQGSGAQTLNAEELGVLNVYGADGDDTLIAAPQGSWLVGGGGSNAYQGSVGNDVFVVSARDDPRNIQGNGGRDTAIIVGDEGVTLNLHQAGLTIAQGGAGHDVLVSGGAGGVFIKGGSGDSVLIGGAGNDVLAGGSGKNTIIGGSGQAVIYAGSQGDLIHASQGGSIIHAGGGNDRIYGGPGNDVIEVGDGNATVDGGGGVNIVSLHGGYSDYRITRSADGHEVVDRVSGRDGNISIKNIQKLNFSDISAVDLQSSNAMPVPDFISVDQQGKTLTGLEPVLISSGQLLKNDQRLNSVGNLRISQVGDAVGGSVSLNVQGDVLFTPASDSSGICNFFYSLVDDAGNPALCAVDLATGETAPMRARVTLSTPDKPADPLVAKQWYLNAINVLPVWQDYTGKGVRIGQFEPGGEFATAPEVFDIRHPDLADNVDSVWLATEQQNQTLPELVSNHATMVAGVMVAARNNVGGVGVAYDARLGGHYLANSGEDLTSLGKMVGYDVTNHSWGFKNDFALSNFQDGHINTASALVSNARYAAHNGRGGLGTIIVTAGGNSRASGGTAQGSLINNNRFSIQVGAINAQGDLSTLQAGSAPFSNPGASLLVSAPGSRISAASHKLETDRGSSFGGEYSTTQGTSFAAPVVSGVVALMLQANPNLGYRDVQQILALSARKVDDLNSQWVDNAATRWNGGGMHSSEDYGFGSVDACAAVRLAESWSVKSVGENETVESVSSGALGATVGAGETHHATLTLQGDVDVEHVEVDFDADLGRLSDLIVRLKAPGSTQSVLLDHAGKIPSGDTRASEPDSGSAQSANFKYTFMSTNHWGEKSSGNWRLEVVNASNGLPVRVNGWSLRAYGQAKDSDDTYFYTNEYAGAVAAQPERANLDDARNGRAGGRNTINAGAVSADVVLDLASGNSLIGDQQLLIGSPGGIQNAVSGDGNDRLIASSAKALLDGGRGQNVLEGGAGQDVFVVHRRNQGKDTIIGFDTQRETVNLVGFGGQGFNELKMTQQDQDVSIDLGRNQSVLITNESLLQLSQRNFTFQDTFVPPVGYMESVDGPVMPISELGVVILEGGGGGVSYSSDSQGQLVASLAGQVYSHDSASSDVFVVAAQSGVNDFRNTLRGFKHGIDKIDLSQTGVTQFSQLVLSKSNRAMLNGLAQIHGVAVETPASDKRSIRLLYLDALEVSQLDESDFIFADAPLHSSQASQQSNASEISPAYVASSLSSIPITGPESVMFAPQIPSAQRPTFDFESRPRDIDVLVARRFPVTSGSDVGRAALGPNAPLRDRFAEIAASQDKFWADHDRRMSEFRVGRDSAIRDIASSLESTRSVTDGAIGQVLPVSHPARLESNSKVDSFDEEVNTPSFFQYRGRRVVDITDAKKMVDSHSKIPVSSPVVLQRAYLQESKIPASFSSIGDLGAKPIKTDTPLPSDVNSMGPNQKYGAERLAQALASCAPADPLSHRFGSLSTMHQQPLLAVDSY
ncbi:S8 family serine peptidase [Pseudomonas sp. LP_7_YM]|uniref:S8 family serine peptidase n=1 Tax=Pseudomonas sp. LP_7_YM TaxID=2485137 RepID=UPI001061BA3D|nr:S8 family serine peptidase [Pseudomonas sp. LP_7_YM]TDV69945.1 subtilisin-like proprotein convertase family protein [Pseudomonas sp. LP_7_YM]